mgnify:CR=1 FL=1
MSIDLSKFWLGLDMPTLPSYTESGYPRYNLIRKKNPVIQQNQWRNRGKLPYDPGFETLHKNHLRGPAQLEKI